MYVALISMWSLRKHLDFLWHCSFHLILNLWPKDVTSLVLLLLVWLRPAPVVVCYTSAGDQEDKKKSVSISLYMCD